MFECNLTSLLVEMVKSVIIIYYYAKRRIIILLYLTKPLMSVQAISKYISRKRAHDLCFQMQIA